MVKISERNEILHVQAVSYFAVLKKHLSARQGQAGRGWARHGEARQGKVGRAG